MRIQSSRAAGISQSFQIGAASEALALMVDALGRLDSDPAVPSIIGAHLQHAIDTLCDAYSIEMPSEFH